MDAQTIRFVAALSCLVQAASVIGKDGRVNKWWVSTTLVSAAILLLRSRG